MTFNAACTMCWANPLLRAVLFASFGKEDQILTWAIVEGAP